MSEDPSWVVQPTPPPAHSREITVGIGPEADVSKKLRQAKAEADSAPSGLGLPVKIFVLAVILVATAAGVGTLVAKTNPVIDANLAETVDEFDDSRTIQGGIPVRRGLNKGDAEPAPEPTVPDEVPTGD